MYGRELMDRMRSNKDYYSRKILDQQLRIEQAEKNNEMRASLVRELEEVTELVEGLRRYKSTLSEMKSRIIKENDEFRTRRLSYLDSLITDGISEIFPNKGLEAKVLCDFKRKNSVRLKLIDGEGQSFTPFISNGKLMQYLISFSAVSGIAKSLGSDNLYIDEAFGVASRDNLPKIGDMINDKIAREGMQIILVSQNDDLYRDIPRHEIHLEYDGETKSASVTEIKDF